MSSTLPAPTSSHHADRGVPDGLPVALALRDRLDAAVRAHAESTLGWQVVDDDATGLVPPALRVVDGSWTGADRAATDRIATVLLVGPDDDPLALTQVAASGRPAAILRWPDDLERLPMVANDALGQPTAGPVGGVLQVGGSAGGTGTTTVAACLAGLLAWQGAMVLLAVRGSGQAAPIVPLAALASSTIMARAEAVPGVDGLRRVRLVDPIDLVSPSDPGLDRLILDAGASTDVDVLVVRPDRPGMTAIEATAAGTVVVNGPGPVAPRALRAAAAGRRLVEVPDSTRVARAGVLDRVPASVPGRWLRALAPVAGLDPIRARDG